MTLTPLSSGLDISREAVLAAPPDIPSWAENLLFALYDPAADIGMWLHLGTVPTDWSNWEDRVLISLPPDQGVLTMWAYHRTEPSRRPAGANLRFECIEPFRRWKITFDGFCNRTPYDELRSGVVKDGEKVPVTLDLDVECATPAWDVHVAAEQVTGQGSMASQGWASEHYEQLYRVTGTVTLPDQEIAFDGNGWRDHSRGPRGSSAGAAWGGHTIVGGVFPSGRAFGLCTFWAPDGTVTLEGAYVVVDGKLHHAEVVEAPRFTEPELRRDGEDVPVALRWPGGEVKVTATIASSMWMSLAPGLPYGVVPGWPLVYAICFARCQWESEDGHLFVERTGSLPGA